MIYNFSINDFEGPLDLLLHLIKENKMEISNINVESITNQYLTFINKMKEESIDVASEYLVMASELVHLKSKMLVNIQDEEESDYEINSVEDLQEKLIEYEKIKEITNTFKDLESNYIITVSNKKILSTISLFDSIGEDEEGQEIKLEDIIYSESVDYNEELDKQIILKKLLSQ